jgi:predicted Fe-Mo cluster-binding NifX family protein
MKIAAISDDGVTISQHFGRASLYIVLAVEDGKILSRESREKMGHSQYSGEQHEQHHHDADPRGHGFDPGSQNRHGRMITAISDCEVLLAGGMGAGAYESIKQTNIRPLVTDITNIEAAVRAYLDGSIVDHSERLH